MVDAQDRRADLMSLKNEWRSCSKRPHNYLLDRPAVGSGLKIYESEARIIALGKQADALKCLADACKSSIDFFEQRYNEHMASARQNTEH